jgi:hypothetical protein
MVAFQFRMGAGFAGDVNRTHPASIEPALNDATNPVAFAGSAAIVNTSANSVRTPLAGDTALTDIWGVLVRAYPLQQSTSTLAYAQANFGSIAPGTVQPVDVLRSGYILVPVNGTVTKGGAVFIWVAASSGAHVQGGFESAATGGSTMALTTGRCYWNGPADSSGIAELAFNV